MLAWTNMSAMLTVAAAVGVIVILCCCSENEPSATAPLPEQYKDYRLIRETTQTEKYSVTRYDSVTTRVFYTQDRAGVVIEFFEEKENEKHNAHTFAVLGKDGGIKDSLVLDEYVRHIVAGYFILQDYYYSWCVDGDKTRKNYRDIAQLPEFQRRKRLDVLAEWHQKSAVVDWTYFNCHDDNPDAPWENIFRYYFFYDNQWWILDLPQRSFDYEKPPAQDGEATVVGARVFDSDKYPYKNHESGLSYVPELTIETSFKEGDYSKLRTEHFYLAHFQREEFYKRRSVSPWSPTGGAGPPPRWIGVGFLDIKLRGDTLRVRKKMTEIRDDWRSYSLGVEPPFKWYAPDGFDFYFLTESQESQPPRIEGYLIKPKK